jgi:hypothetical protein
MLSYTSHPEIIKDYAGTEQELQTAIAAGDNIINFRGGFEVDASILDQLVPQICVGITVIDEESGEERIDNKTWGEYCRCHESINEGKVLVEATPPVDANKNCNDSIQSEELYKWIEALGVENIHTRSNFWSLRKLPENTEI